MGAPGRSSELLKRKSHGQDAVLLGQCACNLQVTKTIAEVVDAEVRTVAAVKRVGDVVSRAVEHVAAVVAEEVIASCAAVDRIVAAAAADRVVAFAAAEDVVAVAAAQ